MAEPLSPNPSGEASSRRIVSIDALRGFDMFWITGGAELAVALANFLAFPGHESFALQFEHVGWDGFRFFDLIFPLFLFVVGLVLPISLKAHATGAPRAAIYRRIVQRTIVLFLLGLIYNEALRFDPATFRLPGVLQRIALVYFFCALAVLHLPRFGQALLAAAILAGYHGLLANVAAPGFGPGDFTMAGNLAGYVDRLILPGKLYYGYGDNEGVLSTVPAIATGLLGVLAGHWLLSSHSGPRKALGLASAGVVLQAGGHIWSLWLPIIKILWTSSFVLVAAGWSLVLLAAFYWLIDVRAWRKSFFFFVVIGANPITIYLLQEFVDFARIADFFFGGVIVRLARGAQPLALAASIVAVKWLLLLFLYRRRVFLRV